MNSIKKKAIDVITYESGRIECFPYLIRDDDDVIWISQGESNTFVLSLNRRLGFSSIEQATHALSTEYDNYIQKLKDMSVAKYETITIHDRTN